MVSDSVSDAEDVLGKVVDIGWLLMEAIVTVPARKHWLNRIGKTADSELVPRFGRIPLVDSAGRSVPAPLSS